MGDYERGVLDGFELALYLHRRHLADVPTDTRAASRAIGRFRREANLTLDALKVHRLRAVALFFGFDDVWTPERAARLYALVETDATASTRAEEFAAEKAAQTGQEAQEQKAIKAHAGP